MQTVAVRSGPHRPDGERVAVFTLVALAWLNPFAPGPSPSLVPWLTGAACTLALWALAATHRARLPWPAVCLVLLVPLAALARPQALPDLVMAGGALCILLLSAASARHRPAAWQLGLLAAAALSAIVGLVQAFGFAAALWPWINTARIGEAYGNLRQPNQFATLCWLGVAVLLWGRPRMRSGLTYALAVLLGLAAAASASRTAILHCLALGVLVMVWRGRQRQAVWIWAAAFAAFVSGMLALGPLIEAATGVAPERALLNRLADGPPGCGSRRLLWSNVLHLVQQHPWTGWGWGELDYAHFWTLYPGPRFCDILDNAHNLPLHLAVELGIPVAVLACSGACIWVLRRRPWAARAGDHRLAWGMLLLLLLHSLLEYPLWYAPFQMAAGLAIGMVWRQPSRAWGASSVAPGLLLPAGLALLLAWAAWDYARVSQAYRPPEQRWSFMREDPAGQMASHWLFGQQARFAQLWSAVPTTENARSTHALAMSLLHYSPEPRVIEQAIASARLAGREADAQALEERYRIAFPERWAGWRAAAQR